MLAKYMKRFFWMLSALLVMLLPHDTWAQGAWEITSFHADIDVQREGGMRVKETIVTYFHTQKHGIYRDIPVKYRNSVNQHISIGLEVLGVTDENGQSYQYEVLRDGAYRRIKIGDPDAYVSGQKTYVIEYIASRGLRYFDDHDELYWNITGNEWEVGIPEATATVRLPFEAEGVVKTVCYTGSTGSTAQDCTSRVEGNEIHFTANDFLTVAVSWPKGFVTEPSGWTKASWILSDNFGFLFPLVALVVGYALWSSRGRDPKGRGVVRQYDAPDKLSPAEMGYLVHQSFRHDHVSAEIVSLAEAGFLKITEIKKDGWLTDSFDYELHLVKDAVSAKPHQHVLLDALFAHAIDKKIKISDLPKDFYKEVEKIKAAVWKSVQDRQYFVGKPGHVAGAWIAAAIGAGILLFIVAAVSGMRLDLLVGGIIAEAILLIFAVLMPKRTQAGVAAYQHALGFKQYIAAAETERVKWQEKQNLFFEVLPFAMVFGLADKWAKAFEGKLQQPPEWYSGSKAQAFSAAHFSRSMSGFSAATMSHAMPPSSSSSGFSGGSSGGGGGGGGGGSW